MEIFGALKIAPMLIAVQFEVHHAKSDRIIGPQISYGVPLLAALFFRGRADGRAGRKNVQLKFLQNRSKFGQG